MPKSTDIRIEAIRYSYKDYLYRMPLKFGGVALDRVTILNVESTVRTAAGKVAHGFGSMPMGNVWAFPSKKMGYEQTLGAMKSLVERIARITADCKESGHPLDLGHTLEPAYMKAAGEVSRQLELPEPIPPLCTLVAGSAFDAALHDAYGKAHGLSCYAAYGPDFVNHDLAHYLGAEFKGEYLDRYIRKEPKAKMPMYHLVGALDPIDESDLKQRLNDGYPETLPEWIPFNGLTHFKIKLNGDDLGWDVQRVLRVDSTVAKSQQQRGVSQWFYSLDFNEKCANVGYLLEFLRQVKEKAPAGFERIQYIEQPTHRDLKTHRDNVMHEAAKLRPVVIDESLLDQESLHIAREMGYTGAALKACKGQTQSLLMAAVAQKMQMFLCVQDLSCPGASLIHSAGLAAHVPGVAAIECNSRQYCPAANKAWEPQFPGIFRVSDGTMLTAELTGPGLSAKIED
jgi:L-alanine-DL-glutamate epimerase-like enolase superfamily enzyme